MLTQEQLIDLHGEVQKSPVLSLYLDAQESDPAGKREWRRRLDQMIESLDAELDPDQRISMRQALQRIEPELSVYTGQLPGRGWVAFATPDQLLHAGSCPAPTPDLVRWEKGLHIAPYVRALKQSRPVLVVLGDQRRARIMRYRAGRLEEGDTLHASYTAHRGAFGSSKRASNSSGIRGESRTDTAQRLKATSTERILREVVQELAEHQNEDTLIMLAGNGEMTAAILRNLPENLRNRTRVIGELHVDASEGEIREAVEASASALSAHLQRELVDHVIDATRSDGRGCLGPERVERALQAGAVDVLVISRSYSGSHPDLANRLVKAALDQGGRVEEVGAGAAELLDTSGGVGARLRFSV
jgi:hypothetical protein